MLDPNLNIALVTSDKNADQVSNPPTVSKVSFILTLDPCFEDASSTWSVHVFPGMVSFMDWRASSITKSARTYAFAHF